MHYATLINNSEIYCVYSLSLARRTSASHHRETVASVLFNILVTARHVIIHRAHTACLGTPNQGEGVAAASCCVGFAISCFHQDITDVYEVAGSDSSNEEYYHRIHVGLVETVGEGYRLNVMVSRFKN